MSAPTEKRFLKSEPSMCAATEFAETFPKIPALVVQSSRCGKAGCRCQEGALHGPYHYLRWREGASQRRRYVRAADVPAVRAIIAQRREARRAERQTLTLSMRSWRALGAWVAEYEAQLREEREEQ